MGWANHLFKHLIKPQLYFLPNPVSLEAKWYIWRLFRYEYYNLSIRPAGFSFFLFHSFQSLQPIVLRYDFWAGKLALASEFPQQPGWRPSQPLILLFFGRVFMTIITGKKYLHSVKRKTKPSQMANPYHLPFR